MAIEDRGGEARTMLRRLMGGRPNLSDWSVTSMRIAILLELPSIEPHWVSVWLEDGKPPVLPVDAERLVIEDFLLRNGVTYDPRADADPAAA
ncbi:MAG: hypothetical protein PsegKO_34750 [Pseudohongiellaceae bacterium]